MNTHDHTTAEVLGKYERLIHFVLNRANIHQGRDDYEDLAQELRIKLIALAEQSIYDPLHFPESFTAYAKQGLYYHLIDLLRRQMRQQPAETIAWDNKVEDSHVIPNYDAENIIDHIAMLDIQSKLDDRSREILRLQYEKGYTVKEIAEQLGISKAAISKRRKKIAELIRKRFLMEPDEE
ncbi:MAG: sigma-70 family RNA polymerase sigma factor [Aerococcus sp.]|nr:sigma-70 family RNA polymerase sigma factor [Aerococcus sp.]